MTPFNIWLVVCADGKPCNLPGFAGTSWEDEREAPYFEKDAVETVVRHLDEPTSWEYWDPKIQPPIEQCRAHCGPHRVVRYVRANDEAF